MRAAPPHNGPSPSPFPLPRPLLQAPLGSSRRRRVLLEALHGTRRTLQQLQEDGVVSPTAPVTLLNITKSEKQGGEAGGRPADSICDVAPR